MKKILTIVSTSILLLGVLLVVVLNVHINYNQKKVSENTLEVIPNEFKSLDFDVNKENIVIKELVYDGLSMEELAAKLDRSLNSTLSGKGMVFAEKSLEYGVDPYLAVAISLHETGCKWTCSYLVRACNNIGGVKGSPSCNGGSYRAYDTLDEGIEQFIRNIANNYVAKGLDNPEAMQRKYTGMTISTWATKVNKYISAIKEA